MEGLIAWFFGIMLGWLARECLHDRQMRLSVGEQLMDAARDLSSRNAFMGKFGVQSSYIAGLTLANGDRVKVTIEPA